MEWSLKHQSQIKVLAIAVMSISLLAGAEAKTVSFPKAKLKIGEKLLVVEVANTEELRRQGLMFRKQLAQSHGMLFVFDKEQELTFWMKDTFIPLSIGFFDKSKKLVSIKDMEPMKSIMLQPKIYSSDQPSKFALEVNRGWFKANNIKLGAVFKLVEGAERLNQSR